MKTRLFFLALIIAIVLLVTNVLITAAYGNTIYHCPSDPQCNAEHFYKSDNNGFNPRMIMFRNGWNQQVILQSCGNGTIAEYDSIIAEFTESSVKLNNIGNKPYDVHYSDQKGYNNPCQSVVMGEMPIIETPGITATPTDDIGWPPVPTITPTPRSLKNYIYLPIIAK